MDEHGLPTYFESGEIHIAGLVVSSYSWEHSHWAARQSLSQWLIDKGVPGMYGVDTRALTKKIREVGALLGNIVVVSVVLHCIELAPRELLDHGIQQHHI
jgi:carbamoyl-phosphate synthase small subunit